MASRALLWYRKTNQTPNGIEGRTPWWKHVPHPVFQRNLPKQLVDLFVMYHVVEPL